MIGDWLITAYITFIALWPVTLVFLAIVAGGLLFARYRFAAVLAAALFTLVAVAGVWQVEHLKSQR